MRNKTMAILLAAGVMLAGAACSRRDRAKIQQTEEETPQMSTTVHVADPRAASQLVSGFYDIEQNSWRWTRGQFAVVLRTPRGAARTGAILKLEFSVPQPVIARLKTVSLTASVDGNKLPPETYTQAGQYTFTRDVPPNLMAKDSVKVEFALDKFLTPGMVENRELGVIVSSIGLETK